MAVPFTSSSVQRMHGLSLSADMCGFSCRQHGQTALSGRGRVQTNTYFTVFRDHHIETFIHCAPLSSNIQQASLELLMRFLENATSSFAHRCPPTGKCSQLAMGFLLIVSESAIAPQFSIEMDEALFKVSDAKTSCGSDELHKLLRNMQLAQ